MTKQLLIYGQAKAVSKDKHADMSVKAGGDFSFAKNINSIPLTAVEFAHAATEFAIVFAGSGDQLMPAVITGVRKDENLFVKEDGSFDAEYTPAFLRRYPFVFSSSDDGANFTLCIDEEYEGCNTEGRGERLFDSEGEQTQYLKSVLEFLQQYQAQYTRTEQFCKKINDLGLLEPMGAQLTLPAGEKFTLTGFQAISREKLKALTGEQLADLASTDELELAYIQIQSMRNFTSMLKKINPTEASE
jgi:SapC